MNKNQEDELVGAMQEAVEHARTTTETDELFGKHMHCVNTDGYEDYKPSLWYRFKRWADDNNPFGGYLYVSSDLDYINKPWKDRSVYRVWYMDAIITGGRVLLGKKKERDNIENFLKYNHPIQFFLRDKGWRLKLKLTDAYDWICHTLNPRQKWLAKQIPKGWADKTWLITEVNFAMVIDFVEGEEAIDVIHWEKTGEASGQFEKELKECYDYVKTTRPKLQEDHDNSYPDDEKMTGDYNVDYAEVNRLELLLNKEDTKWLVWIVTNRDYFWT
jgi:hypothetical protein